MSQPFAAQGLSKVSIPLTLLTTAVLTLSAGSEYPTFRIFEFRKNGLRLNISENLEKTVSNYSAGVYFQYYCCS